MRENEIFIYMLSATGGSLNKENHFGTELELYLQPSKASKKWKIFAISRRSLIVDILLGSQYS